MQRSPDRSEVSFPEWPKLRVDSSDLKDAPGSSPVNEVDLIGPNEHHLDTNLPPTSSYPISLTQQHHPKACNPHSRHYLTCPAPLGRTRMDRRALGLLAIEWVTL